jgi:hypothetical protein
MNELTTILVYIASTLTGLSVVDDCAFSKHYIQIKNEKIVEATIEICSKNDYTTMYHEL